MFDKLNTEVTNEQCRSLVLIELFSPDLVKTATKKSKSDRADVSGHFTSYCLISAPDTFFAHLSALFTMVMLIRFFWSTHYTQL